VVTSFSHHLLRRTYGLTRAWPLQESKFTWVNSNMPSLSLGDIPPEDVPPYKIITVKGGGQVRVIQRSRSLLVYRTQPLSCDGGRGGLSRTLP
jgi:hypothetical protein